MGWCRTSRPGGRRGVAPPRSNPLAFSCRSAAPPLSLPTMSPAAVRLATNCLLVLLLCAAALLPAEAKRARSSGAARNRQTAVSLPPRNLAWAPTSARAAG